MLFLSFVVCVQIIDTTVGQSCSKSNEGSNPLSMFEIRFEISLVLWVPITPFFNFLTKSQDGDHLKFGEALYFYIHPSFGPKYTFQSYSYTFSSKFGDFIDIFNRNVKSLAKKDYFFLAKSRQLL